MAISKDAPRPLRILGFDPGYAALGYAVIDRYGNQTDCLACGVIRSAARTPLAERLMAITAEARKLCTTYKPAIIALEKLFFFRNQKTAIDVAQARGALMAAVAHGGATIVEYTPMQVKQSVSGNGHATKQQVEKMVRILVPNTVLPRQDDAIDALAIALTAAFRNRYL